MVLIREITPGDAEAAAGLSAELGYPATPEAIERRIRRMSAQPDQVVYVAEVDSIVLGWIDVVIVHHLAADSRVEIAGLVVSAGARSQGIGGQLLARAEQWATERGLTEAVVRSRSTRADAHRFYLREGYTHTKTSTVFSKLLTR